MNRKNMKYITWELSPVFSCGFVYLILLISIDCTVSAKNITGKQSSLDSSEG
jgi:hypothetical protein